MSSYALGPRTHYIVIENDSNEEATLCFSFSPTAAHLPVGKSWVSICTAANHHIARGEPLKIWLAGESQILSPLYEVLQYEARFTIVSAATRLRPHGLVGQTPTLQIIPKVGIRLASTRSQNSVETIVRCCDTDLIELNYRRQTAEEPRQQPPTSEAEATTSAHPPV